MDNIPAPVEVYGLCSMGTRGYLCDTAPSFEALTEFLPILYVKAIAWFLVPD
jgi:hypothetical protein